MMLSLEQVCRCCVVVVVLVRLCVVSADVKVLVNVDEPVRNLNHFWRSTGFCPPQPHSLSHLYDLSKDQQLNLALIGSVPHSGLQQVRIHWMLELVSAQIINGEHHYNFTYLDELIDLLWQNNLQPGFELMGSVSNAFSDFEDKNQVLEWRRLVYLIASRYIEKYGLDVVSQWNFETWNEPNNHDFDNITMTIQGFLNYYDACLEGLHAASVSLRFGGPGDSCHTPPHSPYCWALLQHCYNTHLNTPGLHYIALHKKGGGATLPILQQLKETVSEIQRRFPLYRSLPVYNDEADPLVSWNKPLDWRADVTYAAMVVKVISQHQDLLIADVNNTVNFTLLSNDNAFLSYHPHQFTQRTLTARFQINNTRPAHVQLIRKPVLTAMGLLAMLGEQQVQVSMVTGDHRDESSVGVLASVHTPRLTHAHTHSADSWQSAVILYNCRDNVTTNHTETVDLTITGVPTHTEVLYVTHYMDNSVTNPYNVWRLMGSPDYPSLQQLIQLRNQEDTLMEGPVPFPAQGGLTLRLKLPVPSILLIHLCARPTHTPGQVKDLRFVSITKGQVLIVWKDLHVSTRCVQMYEVEFSRDGVTYQRINSRSSMFTSHTFSPENLEVCGWYRVRALDYWGRAGEFSPAVEYTELC
ncbi:alpha-L-iduronidase [Trichomycterus rosablanca]|uniref:alpha-L-iduronidase n=1 Tax=Trichomycterus rosablanca TaxID=2290929 RepID=UPI002F3573A9